MFIRSRSIVEFSCTIKTKVLTHDDIIHTKEVYTQLSLVGLILNVPNLQNFLNSDILNSPLATLHDLLFTLALDAC